MNNKTKTISLRLNQKEYERLVKMTILLSKKTNSILTVSHVIRKLINDGK